VSTADRYRAAGVDLDAAAAAKARIAAAVSSTRTELARGHVGAFGGLVALPSHVRRPNLVMSTDGVGTKVLVAIRAGRHDTVGEDLVNHSVNDILVHGATPLAFLDYLAVADVSTDVIAAVVEGVARACRAHEMALVGGETAQLPDLYKPGHYDLAGTIIGVVEEDEALHGDAVTPGDMLVGYASTGLHTNGYTLARRIFFEELKLDVGSLVPELGVTVGDALLAVHRSYFAAIHPVLDRLHALAHITGGGIPGNLPRSLPRGCGGVIDTSTWSRPPLFTLLQEAGAVHSREMYHVFNMGVGMIAVVAPGDVRAVQAAAQNAGVQTWVVGDVVRGEGVDLREP
jgi:phosphoribosylformylglycinamidine cyclo-ligase